MKKLITFLSLIIYFSACIKDKEQFAIDQNTVTESDIIGKWEMVRYQDTDTNLDRLKPNDVSLGSMIIEFKADNKISGNENCNGLGGDFNIKNKKITINFTAKSLVGCSEAWTQYFYRVFDQNSAANFNKSGDIFQLISEDLYKKVTLKKI